MGQRGQAGRWVWVAAAGAVVMAGTADLLRASAAAASATTEPAVQQFADDGAAPRSGRSYGHGGGYPGGHHRYNGGGGRFAGPPPSDADRADALAFMSAHAPKLYAYIVGLPQDSEKRDRLEALAARAYVNEQRFKAEPDLYNVIVKRVEVQDRVFALAQQLRAAPPMDRPAVTHQLRSEVAALFDLNLQERQLRLARLQRTVQREQARLADDKGHRDRLVEDRLDRIINGDGLFPNGSNGRGPLNDNGRPHSDADDPAAAPTTEP